MQALKHMLTALSTSRHWHHYAGCLSRSNTQSRSINNKQCLQSDKMTPLGRLLPQSGGRILLVELQSDSDCFACDACKGPRSMQAYEGVLPNVEFAACSRDQLKLAFPKRFFPCPEAEDCYFNSSQQLRQHLGPDQIAALQQGSTAWHQARSRHITGSKIADLLGFNSPRPNCVLAGHGVYHAVSDRRQGHHQLLSAVNALRGGQAAVGAAATLGSFGSLCCAWGCKHEAAALHTLLHYTPCGSCLLDSGFVTLNHDTLAQCPDVYRDVFHPTEGSLFGALGQLDPKQVVERLRLGCSLDGLLAIPTAAAAAAAGTEPADLCIDEKSSKRAPPYTWIHQAGYKACVIEVKCPAPFYPVPGRPWAFGVRGALSCQPYRSLKAHHYCQAQLNMMVTGTESCMLVVWTRTRTWLLHVPINKQWLHACLHLLMILHNRYVALPQQQGNDTSLSSQVSEAAEGNPNRHDPITSSSRPPCPPENLFWYDPDPAVRALYRQFILQTARLAASMRSDVLPDPLNLQVHNCSSPACPAAVLGHLGPSTPPFGWFSSIAQGPASAADAYWAAHVSLGTHQCLVRSVNLPWDKQKPLQRDRWFLDRCDPDTPLQPDICHAWLNHPLLEHVVTQPDAIFVLLQLLHEVQQPRPAATAGGGLSPGPVMMAMLLKLEQLTGLQLQPIWQQLPPDALLCLDQMKSALSHAAAQSSLTPVASSLYTSNSPPKPSHAPSASLAAHICAARHRQLSKISVKATARARSSSLLCKDSPEQATAAGALQCCAVVGVEALWLTRRGHWAPSAASSGAVAPATAHRIKQQLGLVCQNNSASFPTGLSAARSGAANSNKHRKQAIARRVVGAARQRQQVLAMNRYQLALKQQPVSTLVVESGHAVERVWLKQPLHVLLQQAVAAQDRLSNHTAAAATGADLSSPTVVELLSKVMSRKRKRSQQLQQPDLLAGQQQQKVSVLCCRAQSAPAVLHTGQFVLDGVSVSPKTGRKVFRRRFRGKRGCEDAQSPSQPPAATPAATTTGGLADRMRTAELLMALTPVPVTQVGGTKHNTIAPASNGGVPAAVPAVCMPSTNLVAVAASQDAQRVAHAADCRQPFSCFAAPSMARNDDVPATSVVTAAFARAAIGVAVSDNILKPVAIEAGPIRSLQRRRRSCPCVLGRRRSPTAVLRPQAAPPAIITGQPEQQQQQPQLQFNLLVTGMNTCRQPAEHAPGCSASTPRQHAAVPAGSPCEKKTTLGWCNLGSVATSPGPLFPPGAVFAAAAVDKPWQKPRSSFRALLQSRSKKWCRKGLAAPRATPPAPAPLALKGQAVCSGGSGTVAVPSVGSSLLDVQQQSLSCKAISHQQQLQQTRDNSPEVLTKQCNARSADAELDDLIVSGVFDGLLGLQGCSEESGGN